MTRICENVVPGILISFLILLLLELLGHGYFYMRTDKFIWNEYKPLFHNAEFSRFTPYGMIEWVPDTTLKLANYPYNNFKISSHGFISNGANDDLKKTDYVIIVVGGSTVEGRGASSLGKTIPAQLERMLNEKTSTKRRIRVLNAGVAGYTAYQQLSQLDGKLLNEFPPNLVISFDGRNDAFNILSYHGAGWKPNWEAYYTQITNDINALMHNDYSKKTNADVKNPTVQLLMSQFKRFSSISVYMEKVYMRFSKPDSKNDIDKFPNSKIVTGSALEAGVDAYLNNIEAMQLRCKQKNIKYFSFIQPVLTSEYKNIMTIKEQRSVKDWGNHYMEHAIYYKGIGEYYKLVREKNKEYNYMVDLSELFVNDPEEVYWDSVHYTDYANQKLAEKIFQSVLPWVESSI